MIFTNPGPATSTRPTAGSLPEARRDGGGDFAGIAARGLGGGQRSVALKISEIGPIRSDHPAEGYIEAQGHEGFPGASAEAPPKIGHGPVVEATFAWPVAFGRKRLPWRLKSAIRGVTSKPTSTSKFAPLTLASCRGMTMPEKVSTWLTRS